MGRALTHDVSNNKEYFNDYYKTQNKLVTCDCGQLVMRFSLYRHKKSKSHQKIYDFNKNKIIENILLENS